MKNTPTTILIADDHPVFCEGISNVLNESRAFRVVAKYHDGIKLLHEYQHLSADLILLDLDIPGIGGLEIIRRIRLTNQQIKLFVLSMHEESVYAKNALAEGANGYLSKSADADLLLTALSEVVKGKNYFRDYDRTDSPEQSLLSDRELAVLKLIVTGNTSEQISKSLHISVLTVKTHRRNMMRKLQAENAAGLVRQAYAQGILR